MEPSKKVYAGKEWKYACPKTQCVITGILVRRKEEKPRFMSGKSASKWSFTKRLESATFILQYFLPLANSESSVFLTCRDYIIQKEEEKPQTTAEITEKTD